MGTVNNCTSRTPIKKEVTEKQKDTLYDFLKKIKIKGKPKLWLTCHLE
jgi:hypothetical protein